MGVMNVRILVWVVALSLFASLATEALAQEGRLLGATRLSRREHDLDVLRFSSCQNVRAIKLKARRGRAEIESLTVEYGNNARDRLSVRHRIPEGGETAWIDLRGGVRCVRAIAVVGDTELSLDQTRIEFWGR
jgi:hypothetical protein